jgi:hypothetical protein
MIATGLLRSGLAGSRGKPIDGVAEHAANGVVVLGSGDQKRVGVV